MDQVFCKPHFTMNVVLLFIRFACAALVHLERFAFLGPPQAGSTIKATTNNTHNKKVVEVFEMNCIKLFINYLQR